MQTAQKTGYSQCPIERGRPSASLLAHESRAKGGSAFKLHSEYQPTGDQPQAIAAASKKAANFRPY